MNKNAKKRENLTYNKLDRIKNKAIKEYYVRNNGELLEFLFENIKGQSKNNIKTILKNNCIGVNGAPVKQFNYPLLKGDVVCVSKYPLEEKIKKDNFKLEIIVFQVIKKKVKQPIDMVWIMLDAKIKWLVFMLFIELIKKLVEF